MSIQKIKKALSWLAIFAIVLPINVLNAVKVEAATTIYVDDSNTSGIEDGSLGNPYNTIQEAIIASASGDTIDIASGTYNITETPGITVDKAVTLDGTGVSTIVTGQNKNASVSNGSDVLFNITVSGVTIKDMTIDLGDSDTDYDVGIFTPNTGGINNLTIGNSTILFASFGNSIGEQLIHLGGGSGTSISNNTFDTASGNSGLYVGDDASSSLTVSNNTIAPQITSIGGANDIDGGGTFFNQMAPVTNSIISGNSFTDTGIAIYLGSGSSNTDTITVSNNTFSSNNGHSAGYGALAITSESDSANTQNITVTGNTFTNSQTQPAVTIFDSTNPTVANVVGSTISLSGNNFSGNTIGGVSVGNGVSGTISATQNWWGSTSGPNHASNSTGTGNSASDNITYRPWCNSSACTSNDSTAPTATLTYSKDSGATYTTSSAVKDADTLKIKATFNESIENATGAMVAIDNSILPATAMAKTSGTVYTYDLDVPTGNVPTATVSLSNVYDTSGNALTASPTNNTFTVDNSNPGLATSIIEDIDSNSTDDDLTNSKQVRISWNASSESGSGISHYLLRVRQNSSTGTIVTGLDDINIGNVTAYTLTSGQAASITNDGLYVFGLRAVDNAGNMSASYSYSDGITIDTTSPSFTIQYYSDTALTNALTNNARLKAGTYYIKVTSSETLQSAPTVSISAEGTANDVSSAITTPVSGNDYKLTRTIASDGAAVGSVLEDISISGTDTAGNTVTNVNPTNEATKVAYTDTTSPGVTVNVKTTSDTTPSLSGTITGVDNTTTTVAVSVNGSNYSAANNGNGTWTLADNTITPGLGENTYSIIATATDTAGNLATDSTSSELIIDLSVPSVDVGIDKTTNAIFTQDATVNGAIAGVASYQWSKQAGPGTITFGSATSEDTTISANQDGTYTIRLTVVDNAGNSTYDEMTLIWDTTKPASTVTTSGIVGPNTWEESVVGTASDALSEVVSVNVKITNPAGDIYNGSTFITGGAGVIATGTTSWSIPVTSEQLTASGDGVYTITSTATDNAGNTETTGTGTFTWDSTNPIITLIGDNPITIEIGSSYTDAGATATDNIDGDLTVVTTNTVDSNVIGQYTVAYNVKDTATNVATEVTRTVNVIATDTTNNSFYPVSGIDQTINKDDIDKTGVIIEGIDTTDDVTFNIGDYGTTNPGSSALSGISAFGKYYEINVSDSDAITFPLTIKLYYTQADLDNAEITEDKLDSIYYYDSTTDTWERYSDTGVSTTDVVLGGTSYAGYVWVNADHLTPIVSAYDITAPIKPANFKATAGDGGVKLTWDKVSDAESYIIRYRLSTNDDTFPYTQISVDGAITSYTITGLENASEYEFGIVGIDRVGNVGKYAVVVATPQKAEETTTPSEPSDNESSGSSSTIGVQKVVFAETVQAEEPQTPAQTIKTTTDTKSASDDKGVIKGEETESESPRAAVTLAILLLALAAGVGGYYGYEWWLTKKEESVVSAVKPKKDIVRAASSKKINSRKRSGRW